MAVLLIIAQQCLFALDTAAIHRIGSNISLMQLGFVRAVGSLGLVMILAPSIGWAVFRTQHPWLQAARALTTLGYAWVLIWSFTAIPMADATALAYVSGLYVVAMAALFLHERVTGQRWAAIALGFAGALLIARPGSSQVSLLYLAILIGTVLNAAAVILTKRLRADDSATTILLYVTLLQLVAFAPGALDPWHGALLLWPWMLVILIAGPLGMLCGIVALTYADASALAPYSYVRLVVATLAGVVLFLEIPDISTIAGAIVIVIGCYYATRETLNGNKHLFGRLYKVCH